MPLSELAAMLSGHHPSSCSCRPRFASPSPAAWHRQFSPWCRKRTQSTALASLSGDTTPAGRTVVVSVDTGTSIEQVSVPLDSERSSLVQIEALEFPLGLILDEDSEGRAVVVEVSQGGNAERAGVALGDVLRATTACMMQMTYPTMNLMFGGVGRPKLTKLLFPTTGQPFSACKDAIRSNIDFDNRVTLVFERQGSSSGGISSNNSSEQGNADTDERSWSGEDSVFDPSLFDGS